MIRLRRTALVLSAVIVPLFLISCSGYGTTFTPTPTISSLSPDAATAGGPSFTLTLSGTGFMTTSQVFWNGSCVTMAPPSTTCATATFNTNTTQLTVTIPASYIATTGFPQITVVNPFPGGPSLVAATFTINPANNPVPTITSLSPSNTPVGVLPPNGTITVNGTNFISSSTVSFNGNPRATQFVSASQLKATVLTADVATAGGINVLVSNPSPGGGVSAGSTFTVGPVPAAIGHKSFLSGAPISPELVSVSASGGPANGGSAASALSANGRFVAFYSNATNLVTGGSSGNIFVRDMCVGAAACVPQTVAADLDVSGNAPDVPSDPQVAISADGRFVAFGSSAPNLVAAPVASAPDGSAKVYLRDLCQGNDAPAGCTPRTELVSVDPLGMPVSGSFPAVSADGRFVAFVSAPTTSPTGTTLQPARVFVRDTCSGPTANSNCIPSTVAVDSKGNSPDPAEPLAISADGRYVVFALLGAASGANAQSVPSAILLADTCEGIDAPGGCFSETVEVSIGTDGSSLPGSNSIPSVSGDGRFVVFESSADASAIAGNSSAAQIYLRDTCAGSTAPNGCAPSTTIIASNSAQPSISSSGRYISYLALQNATDSTASAAGVPYVFDTCFGATVLPARRALPSGCGERRNPRGCANQRRRKHCCICIKGRYRCPSLQRAWRYLPRPGFPLALHYAEPIEFSPIILGERVAFRTRLARGGWTRL